MRTLLFTECVDLVGAACKPFDGTKRYVSTGAVDIDHVNGADTEIIDYEGKPSRANLEVAAGDILFAKMQGTRKTLRIDPLLAENVYSTGFCAVRAKDGILTDRCLYYLLTSEAFLSQKDKNCSGATQKAITNAGLGKICIQVPNIIEQEEAADRLDAITAIIGKRRQELASFDDLVKSRFVEMFGDPVTNPFGFSTAGLTELGSCKNGMNYHSSDSGAELPCLGVADFKDLSIIDGVEGLSTVSLNERPNEDYLLNDGDIVFVRSNGNKELVGRCLAVYPHGVDAVFSGFCIRLRLSNDNVRVPYLVWALKQPTIRSQMFGRGANVQNLNQKILSNVRVPIPSIEMQDEFLAFASQVDKSRSAVQRSIEQLELLKASLMQEYFG